MATGPRFSFDLYRCVLLYTRVYIITISCDRTAMALLPQQNHLGVSVPLFESNIFFSRTETWI